MITTPMTFQQFLANPDILLNTFIDKNTIQLVAVLGFGAYGIVYQGRHVKTGKVYAVKLLSQQKKERFSEVVLHRRLSNHPSILTFEKAVQHGEWTFLVLEYAPDGDLFSAITQPTSQVVGNNDAIRHIFLQIIDAVQYCHRHGVAHRDLKPENILMFPHWQVKLADFGLATAQTVSADFGCGSVFYFSPESQGGFIRNNTRIKGYGTQQNDVWSLGVILINLAAGRNPWKQATMHDPAFAAYVRKPSQFFKGILPCISTELNSILERIFCLDPALRISLPELRLRIIQCKSFTSSHEYNSSKQARRSQNNATLRHSDIVFPTTCKKQQDKMSYHYRRRPSSANVVQYTRNMEYSTSTAMTILQYIQGYIDEDACIDNTSGNDDICSIANDTTSPKAASTLHTRGKKRSSGLYVQPPEAPATATTTAATTSPAPPTPSCSSSSCSSASSTASDCPSTPRPSLDAGVVVGTNNIKQQSKHFSHHHPQNTPVYQWS